jgi:long-chain acyl-CoA synthetase
MLGGTGFLGKVCLSMLLHRFPDVGRVYVMVRAPSKEESESRFWDVLLPSPAFDPLRRDHGSGLEDFLREKLVIVGGDIIAENLGFSDEDADRIASDIDVLLNCSGRVTFNPPLENALKTNVTGTLNIIHFAKRMKRPALIQVSTCFVAGNRSGEIWENEPIVGYFPRKGEPEVPDFSVEQEIEDCNRLGIRVRDEAKDKYLADRFREAAKKRFLDEGRDPDDEKGLRIAIATERKNWIRNRLTELGIEKAKWWGWPNIYCYTKSLGEQVVAAEDGIIRTIVRPAIVESAVEFPFPGWNEGFTTTAPLVRLALKGQNVFPVRKDVILDVVPVDHVAGAVLAVTAQACVETPELVYQLCSGDMNPTRLGRLVTLLGLYKRKHFKQKTSGSHFLNQMASRMEAQAVSPEGFEKYSLPMLNKATRRVTDFLDKVPPSRLGPLSGLAGQVKDAVERFEAFAKKGEEEYYTFRPFMVDNRYVFRADNTRALFQRIDPADRERLPWSPETIDWYDYWLNIHLPGLQKWVFPRLEEGDKPKPRRVYTYASLIELFNATTKNHSGRVALRIERNGREERYTYGDLRECALRAAGFLTEKGVKAGERVGLLSANGPEWGMSYFGIVRTGAACIPIEKDSTTAEIINLLRLGEALGIVMSEALYEEHPDLVEELNGAGLDVRVWCFEELFRLRDQKLEDQAIAQLPSSVPPRTAASIIFTSGTTGNPKGVVLTHRNFTSLTAKLLTVYDLNKEDGMLSVLPLHHSFEFTTGFLLPLSRGAQITYLEELDGETLNRTLQKGQVTCIVGVPALWDSLKRRILGKFSDRSAKLEELVTTLIDANYLLRDETPLNFGPLLFFPIHLAFGGRIRYLISGGSALGEPTLKTLRGLGFNLNEGYGLTEASPVLTVTRPDGGSKPGSVGQPLPGIAIRIHDPDRRGVGEVIARGPNVMAGYYGNEKATRATLKDGWLYTGDLGRIDEEGNLYIVGRLKEVIVDKNGKNVYPDQLEELYANAEIVKELAVVGLPEGVGERVACLVVPDYEKNGELPREEVRTKVEEHFHQVSRKLPLYKRIKTLHITDEELPRTATKKVKRREVVEILHRLKQEAESGGGESGDDIDGSWLLDVVATICEKPRSSIYMDTRLDELGFDSLMYTELAAGIEAAGSEPPQQEILKNLADIRELAECLKRKPGSRKEVARASESKEEKEEAVAIPPLLAEMGRKGLTAVQRWFYKDVLKPEFKGRSNIPQHTHFIVVANHASHLDMGLVKTVLGDQGKNLVALAAADYFFDNKVKRTFFENFTNLVPMERKGSLRKSLTWAFHLLQQGYNVLVFPEGTRSRTGKMAKFQRGVGHLALRARVGVLPIYLSSFEALPPGSWYLESTDVKAFVGPFLPFELLEKMGEGMSHSDAERMVIALCQRVVEALRDGEGTRVEEFVKELLAKAPTERSSREAVSVAGGSPLPGKEG